MGALNSNNSIGGATPQFEGPSIGDQTEKPVSTSKNTDEVNSPTLANDPVKDESGSTPVVDGNKACEEAKANIERIQSSLKTTLEDAKQAIDHTKDLVKNDKKLFNFRNKHTLQEKKELRESLLNLKKEIEMWSGEESINLFTLLPKQFSEGVGIKVCQNEIDAEAGKEEITTLLNDVYETRAQMIKVSNELDQALCELTINLVKQHPKTLKKGTNKNKLIQKAKAEIKNAQTIIRNGLERNEMYKHEEISNCISYMNTSSNPQGESPFAIRTRTSEQ